MLQSSALLPMDFSAASLDAVNGAVQFCKENDLELIILHTYRLIREPNTSQEEGVSIKEHFDKRAQHEFHKIQEQVLNRELVPYQFISEVGFIDDRIAYNLKKRPVEVILLGKPMLKQLLPIMDCHDNQISLFNYPVKQL